MYKKVLKYGASFIFGAASAKVLKSKVVKDATVRVIAEGMKAKESFDKNVDDMKSKAEDLVAEARVKKMYEEREKSEKIIKEEIITQE